MVVYMALRRSPEPVWFQQLTTARALTVTAAQAPAAGTPAYTHWRWPGAEPEGTGTRRLRATGWSRYATNAEQEDRRR